MIKHRYNTTLRHFIQPLVESCVDIQQEHSYFCRIVLPYNVVYNVVTLWGGKTRVTKCGTNEQYIFQDTFPHIANYVAQLKDQYHG